MAIAEQVESINETAGKGTPHLRAVSGVETPLPSACTPPRKETLAEAVAALTEARDALAAIATNLAEIAGDSTVTIEQSDLASLLTFALTSSRVQNEVGDTLRVFADTFGVLVTRVEEGSR